MPNYLASLNEQQRQAASCVSGPVLILAGAGTGKTRTLIHRLAHAISSDVVSANQTLTLTFTNRAAGELRSRLATLGFGSAQVRTFHSAALRQLRFFYPQVFTNQMPTLVSSKTKFIKQAAELCHIEDDAEVIRDLVSEIEWAKVNIISPEIYRTTAQSLERVTASKLSFDQIAQVYETYLSELDQANCMDFEDVLLTTTALLANYPDLAAQVRSQYRYFTVDEFQDVSPIQFELLSLWLGNRDDICVVGDPAQTIYEFTGATADYLTKFTEHFPRAEVFELTQSYRSTPQIIETANQVLGAMPGEKLYLQTQIAAANSVTSTSYSDDQAEADQIVNQIKSLLSSGVAPREIAIIFRMNSQSDIFAQALSEAGIPYSLRGTTRFFDRVEVRNALLHLRANLQTKIDRELNYQVRDIVSSLGWSPEPPNSSQSAQLTWESLNTLVELADEFVKEKSDQLLTDFIAMLDQRNEFDLEPSPNAVTLASIHAVKGLEWEVVFVAGLSEGLVPISYATTVPTVNQERRLFYVALTRAKQQLHLSWAKSRSAQTKQHRGPSRFLLEINR